MPPKAKKTRQYRADRDFNELRTGDVVEMDDDHPYLKTGYMQPVEGETPEGAVIGLDKTTVSGSGASGEAEGSAGS